MPMKTTIIQSDNTEKGKLLIRRSINRLFPIELSEEQ